MSSKRVDTGDFTVELRGEGDRSNFLYQSKGVRLVFEPDRDLTLEIGYVKLADDGKHLDALVDAIWSLALPGVVDRIDVAYRLGDPNENVTVRKR